MKVKVAGKPKKKAVPLEEDERIVAGTLQGAKECKMGLAKQFDNIDDAIDFLEEEVLELKKCEQESIAAEIIESGRTQEWVETKREYKNDHYKCEYCGDTSHIECHDILPYHKLTEDERRDRA